ncbi:sensor histidine kinase [Trebonia kvetii]|uniref:Sensor histidine kinase n=1 Tax=Trebonia kvetii TaxID=2480626 RepID=A0A6P2BQE5_9ACTN|nr:sensor histidine kinase [Trebonia kvetii]TVZ01319.1 sensor histidine kinase [Trebonia kvetii]
MDTRSADRSVLRAGVPKRGPLAGYRTRAGRLAGIVFTGIWLAYLIGPVVNLITQHYTPVERAAGLSIIAAFCLIYVTLVPNWPSSPRYAHAGLAALAALAAAACILFGGMGAASLWIFVSSASGLLVASHRWAVRVVLAVSVCYVGFCYTGHVAMTDFLSNLLPVTFLGLVMIGLRRQVQLTNELHRAREEVVQLAASEERLRLARDMHDLTGQSLSVITLKSELAARLLSKLPEGPERDRVRDEIEQVAAVSRQTLHDIREAISGYRRPTLAVEVVTARAALESAGIAVDDDSELILASGTFDPDAEAALAWCLREAVTNVVRHSGAKTCRISLTRRGSTMELQVRDDGHGLVTVDAASRADECTVEPAGAGLTAHTSASQATGSGLRGISERLSSVGGILKLRPDAHPGFCLIATVPAAREAAEETAAAPAGQAAADAPSVDGPATAVRTP